MKLLKNKPVWLFVLIGLIFGVLLTVGLGNWAYEKMTGKSLLGKWHYVFDRGKKHALTIKKTSGPKDQPGKATDKVAEFSGEILLEIHADKALRSINPMIYGSNLSSKAEFEMDVAKLAKTMGVTNLRFPGGNSMGYRWQQARYDFERRYDSAPLANMDNVVKFCGIAGAEIVVQVNVESGTPEEAAAWVQHMNFKSGSRVNYWELGNEVYGDWDRGFMTGEEYAKLIHSYVDAMKAVDPTIKIGANWGGIKYQDFDQAVAQGAFDAIDFVSYHWYPNHTNQNHKYKYRTRPLAEEIMANSLAVKALVDRFDQMVEKYAPERKGKIEFAVMEWDGSWDGVASDLNYEYKGMMWSLANAIFYANTLGEFARHGVTVANSFTFQEIMFGFIRGWDIDAGWGGSRWDGETIRPKGLAFQLMANHFKGRIVESALTGSPVYFKEADWRPDSYAGDVPYVQGFVSRSDHDSLTIVLTNQHETVDFKVNISIQSDGELQPRGEAYILNGPSLSSQNDGSPRTVDVKKFEMGGISDHFSFTVPAHSVNVLKLSYIKEN